MEMKALGRGLRTVRLSRGLALQDIVNRTGLSIKKLLSWEEGQTAPELPALFEVLKVLDSSLAELEKAAKSGRALTLSERFAEAVDQLTSILNELEEHEERVRYGY
jgi:transcriptional regulator with XRE-family HTH domain